MTLASAITEVRGRAIVLGGNDIDTDRIMPARFLKAITFEGIERHLFEDDRTAEPNHPLNVGTAGAAILLTGANFGCGSSREHAPQALLRWGFKAIVAESFSPIFAGNALAIGLVCVTTTPEVQADLTSAVHAEPRLEFVIDLNTRTIVTTGSEPRAIGLSEAQRHAWLTGEWDATGLLLARYEEVDQVDARLPYQPAQPASDS